MSFCLGDIDCFGFLTFEGEGETSETGVTPRSSMARPALKNVSRRLEMAAPTMPTDFAVAPAGVVGLRLERRVTKRMERRVSLAAMI